MRRNCPPDIIAFDRFWRAGHPMRPRTSAGRRWSMFAVLLVLSGIIGVYAYVTNSDRVRSMAETYLSQVLGGRVEVRRATLSIFEGLRLDDVKVHLSPERGGGGAGGTDAPSLAEQPPPIFSADTFVVRYSLRKLLAGRIEATQIIARRPHVQLTQDIESIISSYRNAMRDAPHPKDRPNEDEAPEPRRAPPPLPQISIRDARIDYREVRPDGTTSFGTLALEGQFSPVDVVPDAPADSAGARGRYRFFLQSRGMSEKLGPYIEGEINPAAGTLSGRLRNFELGTDIRLMLPAPVRQWWERHELSGKVDITELSYALPPSGRPGGESKFSVTTQLQGVTLTVRPGELQGSDETNRVAAVRGTMDAMTRVFAAAGYPRATGAGPLSPIDALFESGPLRLDDMNGTFLFTDAGIAIRGAHGDVEGNRVYIDGQIDGYPGRAGVPEPPAKLRITSGGKPLVLPAQPGYTNALPRAVREIYDQLRPQGSCLLDVSVSRPTAGAKIGVDGGIDVLDGNFVFLRFPYPVRKATGKITFAPADDKGPERLEIDLRGFGIAGGSNENTIVNVVGVMGPLGNDAGVGIRIWSDDVYNEPAMTLAFPADVQKTLAMFDAEGLGRFPTFQGSFTCDVNRAVGPMRPWLINTHVKINSATGSLAAFPYPLTGLAMELKIGQNNVEIINANVTKGDAKLRVDGRVSWAPTVPVRFGERVRPSQPTTVTELRLVADNIPIDDELLGALPEGRRAMLKELGLGGRLDLTGVIRNDTRLHPDATGASAEQVDYNLVATLREGTVWPRNGTFVVGGLGGKVGLSPTKVSFHDVTGNRGETTFSVNGAISSPPSAARVKSDAKSNLKSGANVEPAPPPVADLSIVARNLALDAPLYAVLPTQAQRDWDEVRPRGTVDVDLKLAGPMIAPGPSDGPGVGIRPTVTITPRELAVHPKIFPYPLERVTGRVVGDATTGRVTLHQVSGRRGDALVSVWGDGVMTPEKDVWNLTLFARDVPADEALLEALPDGFATTLRSLKMSGKVGWYVPKFVATTPKLTPEAFAAATASGAPTTRPTAIDMSGKVYLAGAAMDVGVQLAKVDGTIGGTMAVVDGRIEAVKGSIDFDTMTVSDRAMDDVHALVDRAAGSPDLRLTKLRGQLAGGDIAGDVTLTSPLPGSEEAAGAVRKPVDKFTLNIVLRDADAAVIAGEGFAELKGHLSASLALEGTVDAPNSRRGRGDVLVSGKEMYNLPLVLGLLQITNLALPVSQPVNEASARYSVDGPRINFDAIELRSPSLLMRGDGYLNYDTRQVAMTFTTDNPSALKVPFISELWRNAQQELFKIEVRGTVQDPKVTNAALNTVTTTVDEVFKAKR